MRLIEQSRVEVERRVSRFDLRTHARQRCTALNQPAKKEYEGSHHLVFCPGRTQCIVCTTHVVQAQQPLDEQAKGALVATNVRTTRSNSAQWVELVSEGAFLSLVLISYSKVFPQFSYNRIMIIRKIFSENAYESHNQKIFEPIVRHNDSLDVLLAVPQHCNQLDFYQGIFFFLLLNCSNNLRRLVGSIPNLKVRHVTMTAEGRVKAGLFGLGGLTFILFLCSQLDWKVSPTKWVEIIFE